MRTPCTAEPDLWFSTRDDDQREAKQACKTCPALEACMRMADDLQPEHGVWAGRTADERNRARACKVCGRACLGARIYYCSDECATASHRIARRRSDARRQSIGRRGKGAVA